MNVQNEHRHASLVAAHHVRMNALLECDLDTLSTVVGEDMVFISSFAKIQTRAEVFAAVRAGTMKIERMISRDISTRIYGDVGILIYEADTKVLDGSVLVEGVTRSTTVYTERRNGWQMVSQHQSRVD